MSRADAGLVSARGFAPSLPTAVPANRFVTTRAHGRPRARKRFGTTFDDDFDPYVVLRVHPAAELDVIRAAYRALARLYHPDLADSGDARGQMVAINRAWAILGDATSRAAFDRSRHHGRATTEVTPQPPSDRPSPVPAWMARHATGRRGPGGWGAGAAGPPPGRPSGSVLDFGIYLGWSLGEVERRDPGYLDWLVDRPEGAPFRNEIIAIRGRRPASGFSPRRARFGFG